MTWHIMRRSREVVVMARRLDDMLWHSLQGRRRRARTNRTLVRWWRRDSLIRFRKLPLLVWGNTITRWSILGHHVRLIVRSISVRYWSRWRWPYRRRIFGLVRVYVRARGRTSFRANAGRRKRKNRRRGRKTRYVTMRPTCGGTRPNCNILRLSGNETHKLNMNDAAIRWR